MLTTTTNITEDRFQMCHITAAENKDFFHNITPAFQIFSNKCVSIPVYLFCFYDSNSMGNVTPILHHD